MTTPTDADREAAANILDEISSLICDDGIGQVADLIRDGEYDEHHTVQMVARHRLLGQRQGIEMAAKGWQDIATAPRDGTAIQARIWANGEDNIIAWQKEALLDSDGNWCGAWCFVTDQEPPACWTDGWCWEVNEDGEPSAKPTHWKPAPEAVGQ